MYEAITLPEVVLCFPTSFGYSRIYGNARLRCFCVPSVRVIRRKRARLLPSRVESILGNTPLTFDKRIVSDAGTRNRALCWHLAWDVLCARRVHRLCMDCTGPANRRRRRRRDSAEAWRLRPICMFRVRCVLGQTGGQTMGAQTLTVDCICNAAAARNNSTCIFMASVLVVRLVLRALSGQTKLCI